LGFSPYTGSGWLKRSSHIAAGLARFSMAICVSL
jgi:hypothetical protein